MEGVWKKRGLSELLSNFERNSLLLKSLTTNRHIKIRKFMREEYSHVLHQFDIWHVGKSIKKEIAKLGKKTDNQHLFECLKSIINHFWWCCASCNGDISELKEKWASILHHASNVHSWEGNTIHHQCSHSDLSTGRHTKWLIELLRVLKH